MPSWSLFPSRRPLAPGLLTQPLCAQRCEMPLHPLGSPGPGWFLGSRRSALPAPLQLNGNHVPGAKAPRAHESLAHLSPRPAGTDQAETCPRSGWGLPSAQKMSFLIANCAQQINSKAEAQTKSELKGVYLKLRLKTFQSFYSRKRF